MAGSQEQVCWRILCAVGECRAVIAFCGRNNCSLHRLIINSGVPATGHGYYTTINKRFFAADSEVGENGESGSRGVEKHIDQSPGTLGIPTGGQA